MKLVILHHPLWLKTQIFQMMTLYKLITSTHILSCLVIVMGLVWVMFKKVTIPLVTHSMRLPMRIPKKYEWVDYDTTITKVVVVSPYSSIWPLLDSNIIVGDERRTHYFVRSFRETNSRDLMTYILGIILVFETILHSWPTSYFTRQLRILGSRRSWRIRPAS